MIYGTNCFKNQKAVIEYYRSQLYDRKAACQKIRNGEVVIGEPPLKLGEELILNEEEGRYFIKTKE